MTLVVVENSGRRLPLTDGIPLDSDFLGGDSFPLLSSDNDRLDGIFTLLVCSVVSFEVIGGLRFRQPHYIGPKSLIKIKGG